MSSTNRWLLTPDEIQLTNENYLTRAKLETLGLTLGNNKTYVNELVVDNNIQLQRVSDAAKVVTTHTDNGLDMDSKRVINVKDPASDQEAATKKYVDDTVGTAATDATTAIANAATAQSAADDAQADATTAIANAATAQSTADSKVGQQSIPQPSIELLFGNVVGSTVTNTGSYSSKASASFTTDASATASSYNGVSCATWAMTDDENKSLQLGTATSCGFASGQPFTISTWVQDGSPYTFTDWGWNECFNYIGETNGSSTPVYNSFQNGSDNNLTIGGQSVTTSPDGAWRHLVHTFDGTNEYAYWDGVLLGSGAKTFTLTGTMILNFGTAYTGGGRTVTGSFGSIRVWNDTCLTQAQVNALYTERYSSDVNSTSGSTSWRTSSRDVDLALVPTYSDLHNDLNVAIDNAIDDIITAQASADAKLPLSGGTMSGNITMNGNLITGGNIAMYAGNGVQSRMIDFGTYGITSVDHKLYESTDQVLHVGNAANSNEIQISETGITLNSANPISVPNGMNVDIPFLHMFRSVYQSISHAIVTTADWDTTVLNRGGFTESGGVITVPEDGLYAFHVEVIWMSNATNTRHQWVETSNSTDYVAGKRFAYNVVNAVGGGHATCVSLSGALNLADGDTVKVQLYQDCGSALNISKTGDEAQSMDMQLYKIGGKI